jgi:hypothetical protein
MIRAAAATPTDLPPAARRWLEVALGPDSVGSRQGGDAASSAFHLRLRGAIRRAPGASWLEWEGEQTYDIDPFGFRWRAKIRIARVLWVNAEDRLDAQGGRGGAKLLGLVPMGSATGPDVTRSQLVRNLAELAFAPGVALRAAALDWSAAEADSFTLSAPSIDADALVRVTVDRAGDVLEAWSPDRPRENGRKGFLHEPYRLEFQDHERLPSGLRIPRRATGTFETAEGDWPYWRYEVIDAQRAG